MGTHYYERYHLQIRRNWWWQICHRVTPEPAGEDLLPVRQVLVRRRQKRSRSKSRSYDEQKQQQQQKQKRKQGQKQKQKLKQKQR